MGGRFFFLVLENQDVIGSSFHVYILMFPSLLCFPTIGGLLLPRAAVLAAAYLLEPATDKSLRRQRHETCLGESRWRSLAECWLIWPKVG